MKISDELLSAVFGCECEFRKLTESFTDHIKGFTLWYDSCNEKQTFAHAVNLDSFIKFAKIWCFEHGYPINETWGYVKVLMPTDAWHGIGDRKRFKRSKAYDIETTIEALEWVVNQVQGLPQNVAGEK